MDDAGHEQSPARPACCRDRLGCPLVRVDAAEEEQVFAAMRVEGKVLQPDTVVDRCHIAQLRMAVGFADRDIMDAILKGWAVLKPAFSLASHGIGVRTGSRPSPRPGSRNPRGSRTRDIRHADRANSSGNQLACEVNPSTYRSFATISSDL